MSTDEYLRLIPCPAGCSIKYVGTEGPINRKGQDYDLYFYEVIASDGTTVKKYRVTDSMSIYPPFTRSVKADEVG